MYDIKMTAYEGDENYIFVSYAHRDSEIVWPIIDDLYDMGYRIWFDDGIDAGAEWPAYIEEHLNRSAAVLVFMTANTVASTNCRKEITYALNKHKTLVYVMLEETQLTYGLDLQLADQQCIYAERMTSERFYAKLMQAGSLEGCRWKSADGSLVKTRPIIIKRRRKRQKEQVSFGRRILRWLAMACAFCGGVIIILMTVAIVMEFTGAGSKPASMPAETTHTWAKDQNGATYCLTCGVETGDIEGDHHALAGVWSDERVTLGGNDSTVFVPNSVVTECYHMSLSYRVTSYTGNPFGTYLLYIRDTGKKWRNVGTFDVTEAATKSTQNYDFDFDSPVSFTGIAYCLAEFGTQYTIDSDAVFLDVRINETIS